jgi:hypothetical protein
VSPDRSLYLRVLQGYLVSRKWHWLLAMMVLIGVAVAGWGLFEAPTPSASDGAGATVQFWRLLSVGSGSLPVLTLASPMKVLEEGAGPAYHRLRAAVLAGAFVISSALMLIASVVSVGLEVTPLIARALLGWFGLALVSGRVFGWNYSWILPWVVMSALLYWGPSNQQGYHWWEFTAQPATHAPSLLLTVGLFVVGIVAYTMSPWRIRRLCTILMRGTTKSQSGRYAGTGLGGLPTRTRLAARVGHQHRPAGGDLPGEGYDE